MGISMPQLLIIVAIVVLLFGTKKLRSLGADLGEAVKGFKKAVGDENKDAEFSALEKSATETNKEENKQKEQA